MIKINKAIVFVFIGLFSTFSVFSQSVAKNVTEDKYDYILLTKAVNAYESGDYGRALSLSEEAKVSRITECDYKNYIFQNLQKLSYVRRCGDNLTDIVAILKEHEQNEALNLVNAEIHKFGIDFLKNSYTFMLQNNIARKAFPEADYLVGQVYRLEGEFELSKSFLLRAYENKILLDVSDVQYDILYALAELSYYTDSWDDYEKYLLLVIKDNRFYTDQAFMDAIIRIIQKDSDEGVEKFFNLYRCTDYFSLDALHKLAVFYRSSGDAEKALKCSSLAAITAVTKITECLSDRLSKYKFKGLQDMLLKAANYDDVVLWGNKNKVWEMFYDFADITTSNGCVNFGRCMFIILSVSEPEEYWRKCSKNRLL